MVELVLPKTVVRRNKLDISLGFCNEIDPGRLLSLGPAIEIRVDEAEQLIDFLINDSEEDRVYHVQHLPVRGREWELVSFARHGRWTIFVSVFSTALACNPSFADGRRRRLACGGTRIIGRKSLEGAAHSQLRGPAEELVEALRMNLFLSEAMTGKNLSNGFNIGGSKSLVHVTDESGRGQVQADEVREFARFMSYFHNSLTQSLPIFIGTGSDLNFHEHGEAYYDLCSRVSPNYVGNRQSARRWGRDTTGNTTTPTAKGVIACLDAVSQELNLTGEDRSILVKGLGGVGLQVAQHHAAQGWRVHVTEIRRETREKARIALPSNVEFVEEKDWSSLPPISLFSPNSSSSSLTADNLPTFQRLGVKAVLGGENNIRQKGLDADTIYQEFGILTFADYLVNGGGAWIAGAEMVERPVDDVADWIQEYQVPTVLDTIALADMNGRSPESLFVDFIGGKVEELLT
ncbi:MAG: hypothetical protein AAF533_14070 [Acidobacteriota bacterium]